MYRRESSCWKNRKWFSSFENLYCNVKMIKKTNKFSVSPYCSHLLSRKENIKFSKLPLVAFHCNCLINCIMIGWGCRPWNTTNITADTYLLVESGDWNTETKCKVCSNILRSVLEQLTLVLLVSFQNTLNTFRPILVLLF